MDESSTGVAGTHTNRPELPSTHWQLRVVDGISLGAPGVGVGVIASFLQIQDMDSGQIGSFGIGGLGAGVGLGLGGSSGNSEWLYFQTRQPETLTSFDGPIAMVNLQLADLSVVSRLVLPVVLEHGSWLANALNANSLDVSQLASSFGLDLSESLGYMRLLEVHEGLPAEPLVEAAVRAMNSVKTGGAVTRRHTRRASVVRSDGCCSRRRYTRSAGDQHGRAGGHQYHKSRA
jgi:hypothetical protein